MDILQYTFFQNALIGAFLASILCGFIGTYIVTRRLVFISGNQRSALSMARMLPKRKEGRSGMNPGVRKQQMMPTLMPKVQNMAMAESLRTSFLCEIHCTPKALRMANTMAERMGLMPENTPMPMPPKEAWVMPPLMKTRRRVTM